MARFKQMPRKRTVGDRTPHGSATSDAGLRVEASVSWSGPAQVATINLLCLHEPEWQTHRTLNTPSSSAFLPLFLPARRRLTSASSDPIWGRTVTFSPAWSCWRWRWRPWRLRHFSYRIMAPSALGAVQGKGRLQHPGATFRTCIPSVLSLSPCWPVRSAGMRRGEAARRDRRTQSDAPTATEMAATVARDIAACSCGGICTARPRPSSPPTSAACSALRHGRSSASPLSRERPRASALRPPSPTPRHPQPSDFGPHRPSTSERPLY